MVDAERPVSLISGKSFQELEIEVHDLQRLVRQQQWTIQKLEFHAERLEEEVHRLSGDTR